MWRQNVTVPGLALIIIIVTFVNVTLNMSLCVREQADIEIEYIFAQAPTHKHSITNIFRYLCMTSIICRVQCAPYMFFSFASSLCNFEFLSINFLFYSALLVEQLRKLSRECRAKTSITGIRLASVQHATKTHVNKFTTKDRSARVIHSFMIRISTRNTLAPFAKHQPPILAWIVIDTRREYNRFPYFWMLRSMHIRWIRSTQIRIWISSEWGRQLEFVREYRK